LRPQEARIGYPPLALPSGCRDSAPIDGTGRYPTGPNGNCFPSDFREFSAKTADLYAICDKMTMDATIGQL
jgi:hypothetical protein